MVSKIDPRVNDLSNSVASRLCLFANDCLVWQETHNVQDHIVLQKDLDRLEAQKMGDSAQNSYLRQVDKSPAPYCYVRATLEYEGKGLETNALQFKHVLMRAMTEVFGQIGASDTVDLLNLSATGDAILRVPTRSFIELWGSMTLFGKFKGQVCAFQVQQVSSSLMGLSSNSRTWNIPQQ